MLITFLANIIICKIILGYSYIFKIIFFKRENQYIKNLDFIYGIFFLIFLGIIFNFFLPLTKIKILVSIIGFLCFFISFFKQKIKINFLNLLFFLFFFSFFTYWNGNNVDSPVYHIQTIKWIHDYKITFGLSILDWHYALNSVWHIFLSILSYEYNYFNTLYVINFIPISFMFSEALNVRKKLSLSNLSLFLASCYLIFFSFIHPFKNGIIFNHLGNPEVDTMGMTFFILATYIFLKYIENKDNNYLSLLLVCTIICSLIKLSYVGCLLFPLSAVIYSRNSIKIFLNKISYACCFFVVAYLTRNIILSSCFVFPIPFSCIKTPWSLSNEQVLFYLNQTKSFARDTRLREKYTDFEHTIYSNDWFLPWFKDYVINDAFLKISIFIFLTSIFLYFVNTIKNYYKSKKFNIDKIFYLSIFLYIPNLYIWFQAPEIRFGWGILIIFPCIFLSLFLLNLNILEKINKNIFYISLYTLCLLLMIKNLNYFSVNNLIVPFQKTFDHSNIVKYGNFNGFKIYRSISWQCADFKGICINKPKKNYFLKKKKDYLFIKTTDRDTF